MHENQVTHSLYSGGVFNSQGTPPGLMLTVPFRPRLKASFDELVAIECRHMTAIVSTYVFGHGFVVGADGLRRDQMRGVDVTENARKIFLIESDGIRLIYAWVGMSSLFLGDGREFSFLGESANIANEIAINTPTSIEEYIKQFAIKMHHKLQEISLPDGRLSSNPNAFQREDIASVLFVGYYNGKPYRAAVKFSQKNSRLQNPYMYELIESPIGFAIFSGSRVILEQFQPMVEPNNLQEASELIRRYLQACVDNRSNYDDCAAIGGEVHIATVTPDQFRWVIPPTCDIIKG